MGQIQGFPAQDILNYLAKSRIWNRIIYALYHTSPILNEDIGEFVPGNEFLRDGMTALADGTNWNPVSGSNHPPVFGDTHTTVGGSDIETITATGVVDGDIVFVGLKSAGATYIATPLFYWAVTDAIKVRMSADPGNDHVLQYIVFRKSGKGLYRYDGTNWQKLG